MKELPLGLATPLRLWAGLLTTGLVLGLRLLAHIRNVMNQVADF